uniref:Complex 1 LYR protein domain-containing protein n=1 Tax=Palpitomonas bilix TaxID=652834 RepID=A0A7S3G6J5_9EUKA
MAGTRSLIAAMMYPRVHTLNLYKTMLRLAQNLPGEHRVVAATTRIREGFRSGKDLIDNREIEEAQVLGHTMLESLETHLANLTVLEEMDMTPYKGVDNTVR